MPGEKDQLPSVNFKTDLGKRLQPRAVAHADVFELDHALIGEQRVGKLFCVEWPQVVDFFAHSDEPDRQAEALR